MENPPDFDVWDLGVDDQDTFQKISELPPFESLFDPSILLPLVPRDENINQFKHLEDISSDNIFSESNLESWYNQENAYIDTKPVLNPGIHASFGQNLDNNVIKGDHHLKGFSMLLVQSVCASSSSVKEEEEEEEESRKMSGRKRSVALGLEEIQKHFNMPITQAAREMKVGLTVLKKRCRELKIMRWPHRKIKSLNSLINNVKEMGLSEYDAIMLEEHKRLIEKLPDLELTERTKKLRQACFKANYKRRRLSAAYH
ncbi:protein RKD4 [Populus trichocarpa]|uniref:RWP-RK domain-containing protein n=1 Tax=Populus trichocarpa TaxID=3694 RepID=A0A2K1XGA6_POPTR|nr:protein RKD4 [Populus trichocarpa]|eukprot:XP_002321399.3 protein RKD4 [Populus trichocarpa]